MADWFKVYNDMLDDPRIRFAISEHSVVSTVILLILSEASKKRSDSIPWTGKDFELIGYALKCNISVPILNACLNLLERIEFIKKTETEIKVLNWSDMQSDYCRGVSKGYYRGSTKTLRRDSVDSTKSVASVSDCPPLLSSSLSGREDCKGEEPQVTWDMVRGWLMNARENGADYTEHEAKSAYLYFQANGWKWGKNPVVDFRAAVERQIQTDRTRNGKSEPSKKGMSDYTLDDYK